MKHCTRCQNDKNESEFYKCVSKLDGLQTWCKQCVRETQSQSRKENPKKHAEWSKKSYYKHHEANKVRGRETSKRWNKNNPEKHLAYKLEAKLKVYGLSKADYEVLLLKQDFKCAICSKCQYDDNKSLSIDHDHKTKAVRGLLCYSCNIALGHLKDDPELATKAAEYLKKSSV